MTPNQRITAAIVLRGRFLIRPMGAPGAATRRPATWAARAAPQPSPAATGRFGISRRRKGSPGARLRGRTVLRCSRPMKITRGVKTVTSPYRLGLFRGGARRGRLQSNERRRSAAAADPLASWNDGPAKRAILDLVKATTDQGRRPLRPDRRSHRDVRSGRHPLGRASPLQPGRCSRSTGSARSRRSTPNGRRPSRSRPSSPATSRRSGSFPSRTGKRSSASPTPA